MIIFVFSKSAEKTFSSLEKAIQERILEKLQFLKSHSDIYSVLKKLVDYLHATHRLRIGSYRIILREENPKKFVIVDIGNRKNVYK